MVVRCQVSHLQVSFVLDEFLSTAVQEANMRVSPGHGLSVQLEDETEHSVGSRVLGAEVELHVADKLLRVGDPLGVGEELGVVLLLRDVEIVLQGFLGHRRVIMSWEDCLRNVDIFPGSRAAVHQSLALIEPHELLVRIPVVLPSGH